MYNVYTIYGNVQHILPPVLARPDYYRTCSGDSKMFSSFDLSLYEQNKNTQNWDPKNISLKKKTL